MLTKKQVALVKLESNYNTDSVPTVAANEILVESIEVSTEGLKMLDRPTPKNTLGNYAPVYAGSLRAINIVCRYRGSGAAGTAPEMGPLMQACGLGETVNAGVSVVYAPVSSGFKSVTIYRYRDGKLQKYTGCVGSLQVSQTTLDYHKFTFSMIGHFVSETDATLVTPTYDATIPAAVKGGAFTVGGYASVISKLEFDLGNVIAQEPDYSSTDGYGTLQIVDRNVTGSFDPNNVLVATKDFMTVFTAGTPQALATGTLGPAAGNKLAIAMPAITFTDHSENDADGISKLEIPFYAAESSGDDQVTFTLT